MAIQKKGKRKMETNNCGEKQYYQSSYCQNLRRISTLKKTDGAGWKNDPAYLGVHKRTLFLFFSQSKHKIEEPSLCQVIVIFCGRKNSARLTPLKHTKDYNSQKAHGQEIESRGIVKGFTMPGRGPIEIHHQTLHALHLVEKLVVGVEEDSISLLERL